MNDRNRELIALANAEVEAYKSKVEQDPYRLTYHIMPPVGLLNDPNGFIQYRGTYHLFYQWNPFATEHGAKFWGHYTSKDLVHWQHEKIALAPGDWFDKNGCYSGSAVEHDGKIKLIYTGNVKDKDGNRETYQCLAVSENGVDFEKQGVVVELPDGYTAHFRDPKVWQHNGSWYMVIGAQSKDLTGKAVLLRSTDLKTWEHLGPIAGAHMEPFADFGYMWECPDLFELDGRDVLIFSPQGIEPEGIKYNNLYQAGYVVGDMDYETVRYKHGSFVEMDRGFEFYAPQTTLDEKGRRILFGWLGIPEEREGDHPTLKHNWIHAMTLPRELRLIDGKLIQKPVEELKQLRKTETVYENVRLTEEPEAFAGIEGKALELFVEAKQRLSGSFTINIRNHVTVHFNDEKQLLSLKRISFVDHASVEERHCFLKELKNLRVFLDASSIELFANDGEEVFTARMYPDPQDVSVTFVGKGTGFLRLTGYQL
ncbi:glycoside hydrolase family 32 protein [Halalkalibacterium ligniniphilum]|uniref:glycoside hydrolase family 32 protein n=1 Tax=Halalkalibacterium ligniniphilum TaxID=1134413 RepID=UPI000475878D|nr:sucrose-6-phosphate hydrolase [Halalkalibacterium ligniniphilum]